MNTFTRFTRYLTMIGWAASTAVHGATATETLFDGKTLNGWDGDPQYWQVEDSAIVGRSTAELPLKQNTYLAWQGDAVTDFELRVEFKIVSGNSGIIYRGFPVKDRQWDVGGYQADMSADHKWTGAAYGCWVGWPIASTPTPQSPTRSSTACGNAFRAPVWGCCHGRNRCRCRTIFTSH